MIRTWGFQTLTGSAQPWFGDKITAAFSNVKPDNGLYTVAVANAALYIIGDRIILGAGSANANVLLVEGVNATTNILSCASEGNAAVTTQVINTKIALSIACYGILLTGKSGNAGSVWVGADSTVTNSGGGSAFYEIGKVSAGTPQSPFSYWKYDGQNPLRTTEGWVAGTLSDTFAAAAFVN
jgi:hypothetical protein